MSLSFKKIDILKTLRLILICLVFTIIIETISYFLISNLGSIILALKELIGKDALQLSDIFSQIKNGRYILPFYIPLFGGLLIVLSRFFLFKTFKIYKLIIYIFIIICISVSSICLTILLTKVNGIMFGRVISSLLNLIENGGLNL